MCESFFMIKTFPTEFVVAAGLLAAPLSFGLLGQTPASPAATNDSRLHVLENFFAARHCPIRQFAADFLIAADQNGLDWRLLPSISLVESGGGKNQRNNNIFGWNSGKHRFSSVQASIYATAGKLAHSKLYRNKDLAGILRTYNTRPQWGERVKAVMQSIGSAETPAAVAALN